MLMDWQGEYNKNDHLPKAIYRFNAISTKIPTQFYIELDFIWNNNNNNKKNQNSKNYSHE